jgi:hypothetical protein
VSRKVTFHRLASKELNDAAQYSEAIQNSGARGNASEAESNVLGGTKMNETPRQSPTSHFNSRRHGIAPHAAPEESSCRRSKAVLPWPDLAGSGRFWPDMAGDGRIFLRGLGWRRGIADFRPGMPFEGAVLSGSAPVFLGFEY